jgi:hypothetical protein
MMGSVLGQKGVSGWSCCTSKAPMLGTLQFHTAWYGNGAVQRSCKQCFALESHMCSALLLRFLESCGGTAIV